MRFLKALIYGLVPQNGVTGENAIREIFSIFPQECQLCGKTMVGYFYDIPDWYRQMLRYGPYHNDAHCVACHRELMAKEGYCVYCRQIRPEKAPNHGPQG
ncbi:MAG TPA: hypothetical protein VF837_03640 [Patescibacteria group bacterium]